MSQTLRLLIGLLIILALVFAGYEIGKRMGRNDIRSQVIENYSFVRQIAELASLEVNGVSTFSSTNLSNDGTFSDAVKRMFIEKTIRLSMPYTAKYGVNLRDSTLQIIRKDSMLEVHLPAPQLLSYELRIDRMDASNRSGLFSAKNPDLYDQVQRQLYIEGRQQLAQNAVYMSQAGAGVAKVIVDYFATAGQRAICIFDLPQTIVTPKG